MMAVNGELKRMWKDTVAVFFKLISPHLYRKIADDGEKPVCGLISLPGAYL
jgi:hypothetical protein